MASSNALGRLSTDPRRLSLLPTGAGKPRALPAAAMDVVDARWSPGGKQLLVIGTERGKGVRLYTMDVGAKEARPFTRPGTWLFAPSPDGSRGVAWSLKSTDVYPIDGGEPRAVPGVTSVENPIQWRADGRALYMGRFFNDSYRIDEVDLATGSRVLWKELALTDPIRTVRMTPNGEAYAYDIWSTRPSSAMR